MEVYFGGLVEFTNKEELETFLNNISDEDSIQIIETVMSYATKSGLFDLDEAFLLYKCISKIKQKDEVQKK